MVGWTFIGWQDLVEPDSQLGLIARLSYLAVGNLVAELQDPIGQLIASLLQRVVDTDRVGE